MKNMKKILSLVLVGAMVASMAACGGKNNKAGATPTPAQSETGKPEATKAPEKTEKPVIKAPSMNVLDPAIDYSKKTINAGSVQATIGSSAGGVVGHDVYSGVEGKDYTDPAVYTYNDYTAGTSNMKWSTHTWETADDRAILDYISSEFYTFKLNSDRTGWSIIPVLAADYPVDVTADYVGKYGINAGEKGKAWKIAIDPAACWEDGTPIDAQYLLYSYKELLNPKMLNRRADSVYAGTFQIVNAKNYLYGGTSVLTDNKASGAIKYKKEDLKLGADGVYYTPDGGMVYIGLDFKLNQCGGKTLKAYVDGYGTAYFDVTNWEALIAKVDKKGLIPLTEENYKLFVPVTTGNPAWNETEADVPTYFVYEESFEEVDFSEVGIIATDDNSLIFITTAEIEEPNYYVPYNLGSSYLVYKPLWESCKKFFDKDGNQVDANSDKIASITTDYCTTKDTTMSYGPYKLTYFELDKKYTLSRNENWWGYKSGKFKGQYQTDVIDVQVIADHATQLLAFLNGEVDAVGLQSEDMEKYGSSSFIHYTPQSYTTKLSFNTDMDALKARKTNAQVLTNAFFRKGFSLAIDRNTFAKSYTAAGTAGYGLLNKMYVYDPFTGAAYRDTDGAMDAIVSVYGITYGPDGDFDTLEEAYEAVTGYEPEKASACMQQAYNELVTEGVYDGVSPVTLQISVYNSDDIYVKMFNYLNDALKAACKGTSFEGKVSLTMVVDADYYDTMNSGGTDIIFSTWGGAANSPFTLLYECYCDAADGSGQQMEYGFDTEAVKVTLDINGKEYTQGLRTWALWMDGNKDTVISSNDGSTKLETFATYDAETKAALFGKMEYAYLSMGVVTPVYYRNVASLHAQKLIYPVDHFVNTVEYGGLEFITYKYNDEEWAKVKSTITY